MVIPDSGVAAVIAALSAAFAATVTHFLTKKKQDADVNASIAAGAGAAVDTIADVLDHLRLELDQARKEIAKLREENAALRKSITSLSRKIGELQAYEQQRLDKAADAL